MNSMESSHSSGARVARRIRVRIPKNAERVLLLTGLALVGWFVVVSFGGRLYSRMALSRFHSAASSPSAQPESRSSLAQKPVNFGLWSEKRIREYQATLLSYSKEPIGVLRIEKIDLEVPVFDGTDDFTLNRGVGRIIGTARPDAPGNLGIAGHRDGFFRGLKDITVGDTLQVETRNGTRAYRVDNVSIVSPTDVSVLKNESNPSLTLVTCYPFYFIGDAPQRYIVHASVVER
jgi:sortase A